MQAYEIIKTGINYIEQNLKTDITADELAAMAGYSTFHYYRLFSSAVGMPIASYILKRRLDHALGEIAVGRKAVDVVLEYGFDTYAGFYKAFIRMYGCSPKKYLSIYKNHKPIKPEVIDMYNEKELRKILKKWDMEEAVKINDVYIMNGTAKSNTVWAIGSDYYLKTGKREQLIKNLKIAKALNRHGFQSAMPVITRDGSDYADGTEVFVLTHRLPGGPLDKSVRYGSNRFEYGEKYGRSIAGLHRALIEIQSDIAPDDVNPYQVVTDWALPNVRQQNSQWNMGLTEEFFQDYINTFGAQIGRLPKQLIHRDPNPDNILFDGGEVSGFLDFDISEINVRLWDVCYCTTGILSESGEEDYDKWFDILSGVLHGYDDGNSLTSEEKQAVYYVICSIQMIFIAYCEEQELKQLAKTNRNMLRFIAGNKDKILRISEKTNS